VSPGPWSATTSDMAGKSTDQTRHAAEDMGQGPRFSYAVGTLDRSIRRSLGAVLRPFDVTVAEYTALSLIERRDGYSNAELARPATGSGTDSESPNSPGSPVSRTGSHRS
jgi:hypothetical protein